MVGLCLLISRKLWSIKAEEHCAGPCTSLTTKSKSWSKHIDPKMLAWKSLKYLYLIKKWPPVLLMIKKLSDWVLTAFKLSSWRSNITRSDMAEACTLFCYLNQFLSIWETGYVVKLIQNPKYLIKYKGTLGWIIPNPKLIHHMTTGMLLDLPVRSVMHLQQWNGNTSATEQHLIFSPEWGIHVCQNGRNSEISVEKLLYCTGSVHADQTCEKRTLICGKGQPQI